MKKRAYLNAKLTEYWPQPKDIEGHFLAPPDQRWFFNTGNDVALFEAGGLDATEHLKKDDIGYKQINFWLTGHRKLGMMLSWVKWDGEKRYGFHSKGDLTRLREHVRNAQGDLLPAGLFIPFEEAWKAVKEFIENDGALPKSIEWVADEDLPPNTFPDPFGDESD